MKKKKSFDRKARFMDTKKYNSFSKSFIQILESDDALNGTGWGFLKQFQSWSDDGSQPRVLVGP